MDPDRYEENPQGVLWFDAVLQRHARNTRYEGPRACQHAQCKLPIREEP